MILEVGAERGTGAVPQRRHDGRQSSLLISANIPLLALLHYPSTYLIYLCFSFLL